MSPKEPPVKRNVSGFSCPSSFFGIPIATIAEKAKRCKVEDTFLFPQEYLETQGGNYLTAYEEAEKYVQSREAFYLNLIRANTDTTKNETQSTCPDYVAFTDGGSRPSSGGPGGWGCLLFSRDEIHVYSRSYKNTTNNRMELRAVLCALRNVPEGSRIDIYSDSEYVINTCEKWLENWKRKGLLCPADKSRKAIVEKTPLNKDLLLWLYDALKLCNVTFHHVRAHSGNLLNEFVDSLCHLGSKKLAPEYIDVR